MTHKVYTVVAYTGEYDNWHARNVAAFTDRAIAEKLATDAQAVADALIARNTGVKDRGQNPHDLLMRIEDGVMAYSVVEIDVFDAPPLDPASDVSILKNVRDHFPLTSKDGDWNAFEVEFKAPARAETGKLVEIYDDAAPEKEREPVLLRTVEYRGFNFQLQLHGHTVVKMWEGDAFSLQPSRLEDLTPETREELCNTGRLEANLYFSLAPHLVWTCEAFGDFFYEQLDLVSSDPTRSVQQLVRVFEAWLIDSQKRREHRQHLDELLSRFGL